MRTFTVEEIIHYAQTIEQESYAFYTAAKEHLADLESTEVAEELAQAEIEHLSRLRALLDEKKLSLRPERVPQVDRVAQALRDVWIGLVEPHVGIYDHQVITRCIRNGTVPASLVDHLWPTFRQINRQVPLLQGPQRGQTQRCQVDLVGPVL